MSDDQDDNGSEAFSISDADDSAHDSDHSSTSQNSPANSETPSPNSNKPPDQFPPPLQEVTSKTIIPKPVTSYYSQINLKIYTKNSNPDNVAPEGGTNSRINLEIHTNPNNAKRKTDPDGRVNLQIYTKNPNPDSPRHSIDPNDLLHYKVGPLQPLPEDENPDEFIGGGEGCEDFCSKYCNHDPYEWIDPRLEGRPSWIKYFQGGADFSSKCRALNIRDRIIQYTGWKQYIHAKKWTKAVVDEKGHLLPSKSSYYLQKRPLWGYPATQWELDESRGKRSYRSLSSKPSYPLPHFFAPMPPKAIDICFNETRSPTPTILNCRKRQCRHKLSRGTHRDYRGKHPKGNKLRLSVSSDAPNAFLQKLMDEIQELFDQFLDEKVPILCIYGQPIKTIATIRRRYCVGLAEKHDFTYIYIDDEIARLAAKGSRAIADGNPLFEGFTAVEKIAIPICITLVKYQSYTLSRTETLDLLKLIMLLYFPTDGYIIDGYPWDETDNKDFEKYFYPMTCGIYFLDTVWTNNKLKIPQVNTPLYFRRSLKYNEHNVETACGNFGLKTLKIINAESLVDSISKAVDVVIEEYLDAYEEVLEGNEEVLRDDTLTLQHFGQTVGYGLDLDKYMKATELS